ncbi:MAG: AAA family ATPase [Moraxella sp.]|nr:AAA family ATPase [Moraxella sp.]
MKILQSKYFRPRKIMTESYRDNQYNIEVKELDQKVTANNTPFSELIGSLMPSIDFSGDNIVIKKEHLQHFVQCTDYHTVNYDAKSNRFYEWELCYFYPEFEFFLLLNEDLSNEYDKYVFEAGYLKVERLGYDSTNEHTAQNVRAFFDRFLEKYVSPEAKILLLLKEGNDLVFRRQSIKPYKLDLTTMYNDDFLPIHQKIKDELTHGTKGVVLLHGLAGAGKTNYIKWLTAQVPDKDFIFVPNNLIGALAEPQFMSLLIEKKNSVLVLEDCENYIAERVGGGNTSDVVATILNIADGILSDVLECQFICTFNADLLDIDHALLRRGRLIAEYQFGKLSADKCNSHLQSLGKDIAVDKPMTLAELTHIDEAAYRKVEEKGGFGFV